jgi:hypothetical protein
MIKNPAVKIKMPRRSADHRQLNSYPVRYARRWNLEPLACSAAFFAQDYR